MKQYLEILEYILLNGKQKKTRTGTDALTIDGATFEHDMSNGFPLLTTKKIGTGLVFSELEFFIRGLTDKKWLQDRNNHIWDNWCNPKKAPYAHDPDGLKKMLEERDLGPIYGFQWRHFGAKYRGYEADYSGEGVDQLENVVETLKIDSDNRRMIVSAWNPNDLEQMALPPCHYSFQVTVTEGKLNLFWNQRSVDTILGLPFNIASYALLLQLLAKESGFEEGKLRGNLGDTHIYENHINGAKEQLTRNPRSLPRIKTENFKGIFNWEYTDSTVENYDPHPRIKFDISV